MPEPQELCRFCLPLSVTFSQTSLQAKSCSAHFQATNSGQQFHILSSEMYIPVPLSNYELSPHTSLLKLVCHITHRLTATHPDKEYCLLLLANRKPSLSQDKRTKLSGSRGSLNLNQRDHSQTKRNTPEIWLLLGFLHSDLYSQAAGITCRVYRVFPQSSSGRKPQHRRNLITVCTWLSMACPHLPHGNRRGQLQKISVQN